MTSDEQRRRWNLVVADCSLMNGGSINVGGAFVRRAIVAINDELLALRRVAEAAYEVAHGADETYFVTLQEALREAGYE